MQDGFTRKVQRQPADTGAEDFLASHRAAIVTLSGATSATSTNSNGSARWSVEAPA